jgi:hypothetical protein
MIYDKIYDRREEFSNYFWQQGRTLLTPMTKRWTKEELDNNDSSEKCKAFVNFFEKDQGRSRELVYIYNSIEECENAIKNHNNQLLIEQKKLVLVNLIQKADGNIIIPEEFFNYILLFGWEAGLKDYNELDLDEKEEKYLNDITKYVHSL